jgi:putative alpha-1,2-mannosidase
VLLNGKELPRGYVRHEEIMAGGELRFVMSAQANRSWATGAKERPYSMTGRAGR